MAHLIDKNALVAEINKRINDAPINNVGHQRVWAYNDVKEILDTLEVKDVDVSSISENLAEAYACLDFTHTSNLAHNKPMVAARLRKAIRGLFNAGLFKLTHDEKYRMENLGLKVQKGE